MLIRAIFFAFFLFFCVHRINKFLYLCFKDTNQLWFQSTKYQTEL